MRKWVHVAGMQGAWFAAALLASTPWHLVGALANVVVLAVHVASSGALPRELSRAAFALGLGFAVELVQQEVGGLAAEQAGVLPPLWLLSLWPVFASAMMQGNSLAWVTRRLPLAAVLGAIAGPVSYAGGARLGALRMDGMRSVVCVGVCWAVAMPTLAWWSRRREAR
jgi:hypothetical protein